MGIRFEKDTRKATNGPLIFFTNIQDEVFREEINSAFLTGLSFYAYRFPHDSMMSYGSSESFIEGLGMPGFVIGMFDPAKPYITIPYKGITKNDSASCNYTQPFSSTTFNDYSREVENIIKAIKAGAGEKVVAARVEIEEEQLDLAEKFYELCSRFPDAFIFCFSTPLTGCWIGATPELLIQGKEDSLTTMALAGTRKIGTNQPWDDKNKEEQSYVTSHILDIFRSNGMKAFQQETFTKKTGNIEHICTPIEVKLNSETELTTIKLESLLRDLSPTPAVGGTPKNFALEQIKYWEKFDRGCYGGFCGPYHATNDFTFSVILRCASVSERKICLYAGGGITSGSSIESEWKETELKLSNFRN